jgi:hypothetical protein
MVTIGSAYRKRLTFQDSFTDGVLLSSGFNHFTAFVLTAVRADPMGQFGLVAVRALGKSGFGEGIVRAPFLGACIRVASFRVRHGL